MDNIKVDLSGINFQEIFSAALMQQLDQEKKDALIKQAVQFLMTPQSNSYYGKNVTPLQEAYNGAMRNVAQEHIKAFLEKDADMALEKVN